MAEANVAKHIRIDIEQDHRGVFVAKSPDIEGLLVVSKDHKLLTEELIPNAIIDLFNECGVETFVTPLEKVDKTSAFVAVPAALAKQKLKEMDRSQ